MDLHFSLLGNLQIVYGGHTTPLQPYRVQNLLAFLLLRPRLSGREQIADTLYPAISGAQGRRHLSDALYLLRKALPAKVIFADRERIYLPVAVRWLDVEAFREAMRSQIPEQWARGLLLYHGDLLSGNYEDWLLEEREAIHLDFVTLAHRFGDAMLHQQNYERALSVTERLMKEEPYDEKTIHRLMLIYQALGRRGDALQVYEQFAERLAVDLAIEPQPEVQILAQAIRDACPTFFPSAHPPFTDTDDPRLLLDHARLAFERGRRVQAEMLLMQVEDKHDITDAMRWLEFDLALRFDEADRAQRALANCTPEHPQTLIRQAALSLERRNWGEARRLAEEALLTAISKREQEAEGWALWALASAEYRLGRRAAAYRAGERALAMGRVLNLPSLTSGCLILLGRMLTREGRFEPVKTMLAELISLAQGNDDPWHYVHAMRLSGLLHVRTGRLQSAQRDYEEALRACRHVGWIRLETRILNELAESCDLLGQSDRSLRLLKQAEKLLIQLDDPIPLAINHYNQAFTYLYLDDDHAALAIRYARSALDIFQKQIQQRRWTALGWMALAYALWMGDQLPAALAALDESYRLHEQLREREKFCEILAMKAQVHLALGNLDQALNFSQQGVLALAQGARATDMKAEVYFARAMALTADGDEGAARTYLQQAYEALLVIAARLEDDAARQAFFRRDPITRRLMTEVYARGLAAPRRTEQHARWLSSPSGDYAVQVRWTVDAGPADMALKQNKGAIALRRQRLARLIREAEAQGVEPHGADLAAALGVSIRTIQRDRAYLQENAP